MSSRDLRFIQGGRSNAADSQLQQVKEKVKAKYDKKIKVGGFFSRVVTYFKMRKEISAELEKLAPYDGLYISGNEEQEHSQYPADVRIEGCINCEFNEYREGIRNYCSEHERYVKDCDPPCKAYVEEGSY